MEDIMAQGNIQKMTGITSGSASPSTLIDQINRYDRMLDVLADELQRLHERLVPVSLDENRESEDAPTNSPLPGRVDVMNSPLAERVDLMNDRFNLNLSRLERIINRLDV